MPKHVVKYHPGHDSSKRHYYKVTCFVWLNDICFLFPGHGTCDMMPASTYVRTNPVERGDHIVVESHVHASQVMTMCGRRRRGWGSWGMMLFPWQRKA